MGISRGDINSVFYIGMPGDNLSSASMASCRSVTLTTAHRGKRENFSVSAVT